MLAHDRNWTSVMPEHYEVKRISSYLKEAGIEGNRILALEPLPGAEKILKQEALSQWQSNLENQKVLSISVKAKYTFLELDQGTLMWHYRFTGIPHVTGYSYETKLYTILNLPTSVNGHRFCRFRLHFEDEKCLEYFDTRCLSDIRYFPGLPAHELDVHKKLAPDLTHFSPLSFTAWKTQIGSRKRNLKQELQDQSTYPSGIGNYLACEILACAKLNPWIPVSSISPEEYQALCNGIMTVKKLCEQHANYQWFHVFNRNNCRICAGTVVRKKHHLGQSGQTTHYCPQCQKNLY